MLARVDWALVVFGVAIFGAILARSIHYDDWMVVKSDQIRDAMVSIHVVEGGLGYLPLFGPRAGGTDLRLGPIFYYFQSLSGILFHSASPGALAFPVLLFSFLSLFVFFLVARQIFDRNWSMMLTVAFSYGFLGTEYARFSWNPNSVTFFGLLFFYAFLRLLSAEKDVSLRWYALLGLSYGVVSQLHFTVAAAIPVFVILYSIAQFSHVRSVWSWRGVFVFFCIVCVFYLPVLVGDILNHGKNASEFLEALGSKGSGRGLVGNLRGVTENFGENFFRIATGYFGGPKVVSYVGALLFVGGMWLNFSLFRKELDESRRRSLLAVFLWTIAFYVLYIPLATSVDKPRFYLPLLFVPILFMGMVSRFSIFRWKKAFPLVAIVFLAASTVSNGFLTFQWLSEIRMSKYQYVSPKKDTVVLKLKKDAMWWSWGQVKRATEFMIKDCPHENIFIEYRGQSMDFMHTFLYAFRLAGDDRIRRGKRYDGPSFCRYALLKSLPSGNVEDETMDIGDLRVLVLDKRGGTADPKDRAKAEDEASGQAETWRDVFRRL